MRTLRRYHRHSEDEDESVFISMTDMAVSILFIVLILLAFFASQLRPEAVVSQDEYDRVANRLAERDEQLQHTIRRMETLLSRLSGIPEELNISELLAENTALREELAIRQKSNEQLAEAAKDDEKLRDELNRLYRLLSEREINRLETYNADVSAERTRLLLRLRDLINVEYPELGVRLSKTNDALQFQGEGLFESSSAELSTDRRKKVERIAEIIDGVLPCYTLGVRSSYSSDCNEAFAVVEALQIEGHTDSTGSASLNVELSSRRAAATYVAMNQYLSRLTDHVNLSGQPVLSVAGYGKDRPIADNTSREGRAANRRIDLRFIMVQPAVVDDIARIRERLLAGGSE